MTPGKSLQIRGSNGSISLICKGGVKIILTGKQLKQITNRI